ncbi:hypothetical protein AB1N83_013862 [Pleurotus pulmonarius]
MKRRNLEETKLNEHKVDRPFVLRLTTLEISKQAKLRYPRTQICSGGPKRPTIAASSPLLDTAAFTPFHRPAFIFHASHSGSDLAPFPCKHTTVLDIALSGTIFNCNSLAYESDTIAVPTMSSSVRRRPSNSSSARLRAFIHALCLGCLVRRGNPIGCPASCGPLDAIYCGGRHPSVANEDATFDDCIALSMLLII